MQLDFSGKKILILGATTAENEIINAARDMGIYTIVTDSHTEWNQSPAKYVADEAWNVSWSDIEQLKKMCIEHNVDSCIAGFSEKRVKCAEQLSELMGFNFYANGADLDTVSDKLKFKEKCIASGITVPKAYNKNDDIKYPVIIKPADNGGSKGITICHSKEDLTTSFVKAMENSDSGRVLIEQYIDADEIMVFYTVRDGKCKISAICDRIMQTFDSEITQLPIGYYYPSKYLSTFIENSDKKFQNLIKKLGIKNGLIAFQAFALDEDFIPFDPTYRLDGTMSYHITENINNTNILRELIRYSIEGQMGKESFENENPIFDKNAFQLPILLSKGTISKVVGMEKITTMENVIFVNVRKKNGDICNKRADFSQIYCRIYMSFDDTNTLLETLGKIYNTIDVLDENGDSMIIGRINISNGAEETCGFQL